MLRYLCCIFSLILFSHAKYDLHITVFRRNIKCQTCTLYIGIYAKSQVFFLFFFFPLIILLLCIPYHIEFALGIDGKDLSESLIIAIQRQLKNSCLIHCRSKVELDEDLKILKLLVDKMLTGRFIQFDFFSKEK